LSSITLAAPVWVEALLVVALTAAAAVEVRAVVTALAEEEAERDLVVMVELPETTDLKPDEALALLTAVTAPAV